MGGFDGEGLQSSSVLVVKSHAAVPAWKGSGKPAKDKKVRFENLDSAPKPHMTIIILMFTESSI